ncbi:transposase [Mesotoga sp. B105.6.4]|uniref:transposase n=1 Tax=Mesotoga sp. B105.6.4 TaxID=1582224 RepID=UPI000CCC3148|nr:transposase [Mesotoga sp. B105.6.4]
MKHPRGKSYDPEFKLRLAKEFAETDKTLEEIAQENGISSKTLNNWTVKYRKEGEAAFFKGSRGGSFIRDPNKIPPVLYKELGLDKIRENPSDLKGPFTEKEKLLLEIAEYKLQVKILQEALKKKERNRITDRFLADDYIGLGFAIKFVLLVLSFPRSSYYHKKKVKVILVGKPPKRTRGFCNKRDGTMITDIELEEILLEIFYFHDPYDPRYYLKVLGSKKLSKYLLNEMGIIVNHKKLHRLRKKLRLVRKYYTRHTHPVRRSTVHRLNRPGILWEADIKVISTITEPEVRGKRSEERRDLDLLTSSLIPLTSDPPRRRRLPKNEDQVLAPERRTDYPRRAENRSTVNQVLLLFPTTNRYPPTPAFAFSYNLHLGTCN